MSENNPVQYYWRFTIDTSININTRKKNVQNWNDFKKQKIENSSYIVYLRRTIRLSCEVDIGNLLYYSILVFKASPDVSVIWYCNLRIDFRWFYVHEWINKRDERKKKDGGKKTRKKKSISCI